MHFSPNQYDATLRMLPTQQHLIYPNSQKESIVLISFPISLTSTGTQFLISSTYSNAYRNVFVIRCLSVTGSAATSGSFASAIPPHVQYSCLESPADSLWASGAEVGGGGLHDGGGQVVLMRRARGLRRLSWWRKQQNNNNNKMRKSERRHVSVTQYTSSHNYKSSDITGLRRPKEIFLSHLSCAPSWCSDQSLDVSYRPQSWRRRRPLIGCWEPGPRLSDTPQSGSIGS